MLKLKGVRFTPEATKKGIFGVQPSVYNVHNDVILRVRILTILISLCVLWCKLKYKPDTRGHGEHRERRFWCAAIGLQRA